MRLFLAALALAGTLLLAPAQARDLGQWENVDPVIRQWYRDQMLTPEAQRRFPQFKSCCDHADVVKTRFHVNRTDARDEWFWWNPDKDGADKWQRVPDDVIHWDERAPNKLPTLFIYNGRETCFFPGDGGI